MRQVNSLNHTRWECKYHIVFIPKYRRKALFGQIRRDLADVFHSLATPVATLKSPTCGRVKIPHPGRQDWVDC
jgi:putative transposase